MIRISESGGELKNRYHYCQISRMTTLSASGRMAWADGQVMRFVERVIIITGGRRLSCDY